MTGFSYVVAMLMVDFSIFFLQ